MTPAFKMVATVAAALGWTDLAMQGEELYGYDPSYAWRAVPNFHDSLDACRVMERQLFGIMERMEREHKKSPLPYLKFLKEIVYRDSRGDHECLGWTEFSTAAQRCEACIATIATL